MSVDKKELQRLVSMYCDGHLRSEDIEALRAMLRTDLAARRLFLQQMDIHGRLCWEFGDAAEQDDNWLTKVLTEQLSTPPTPDKTRLHLREISEILLDNKTRLSFAGVALAAVALVVVVVCLWQTARAPSASSDTPVASVVSTIAARWNDSAEYQSGRDIFRGAVELLDGLAALETVTGARILLEAPVSLYLLDAGRAYLHSGRIVVHCDRPGEFVVDTRNARVIDKGTEFGVSTEVAGETLIQVFEGKVRANSKGAGGQPLQAIDLLEGEAYRVEADPDVPPRKEAFKHGLFVRRFPESEAGLKPFHQKRAHIERISIVRTLKDFTVDGDLSDWNHKAMFVGRLDPPLRR